MAGSRVFVVICSERDVIEVYDTKGKADKRAKEIERNLELSGAINTSVRVKPCVVK